MWNENFAGGAPAALRLTRERVTVILYYAAVIILQYYYAYGTV